MSEIDMARIQRDLQRLSGMEELQLAEEDRPVIDMYRIALEALVQYGDMAFLKPSTASNRFDVKFMCEDIAGKFGYDLEEGGGIEISPFDLVEGPDGEMSNFTVADFYKTLAPGASTKIHVTRDIYSGDQKEKRMYELDCRKSVMPGSPEPLITARIKDKTEETARMLLEKLNNLIDIREEKETHSDNPSESEFYKHVLETLQSTLGSDAVTIFEYDETTSAIKEQFSTLPEGEVPYPTGDIIAKAIAISKDQFPATFKEVDSADLTGMTAVATFPDAAGKRRLIVFNHKDKSRFSTEIMEILPYITKKIRFGSENIKLANERLTSIKDAERLARKDQLTGLDNRRAIREKIFAKLAEIDRTGVHHPITLAMIDIDNFKSVNDTFGQTVGDRALKYVAEKMTSAGGRPGDEDARWGGEEFMKVYDNTSLTGGLQASERTRRAVEAETLHVHLSVSERRALAKDKKIKLEEVVSEGILNLQITQGLVDLDEVYRTITAEKIKKAYVDGKIIAATPLSSGEKNPAAYQVDKLDLNSLRHIYGLELAVETAFQGLKMGKKAGKNIQYGVNYAPETDEWYVFDGTKPETFKQEDISINPIEIEVPPDELAAFIATL
jgi:diguanylate cyclase (GGDEF)-like protein